MYSRLTIPYLLSASAFISGALPDDKTVMFIIVVIISVPISSITSKSNIFCGRLFSQIYYLRKYSSL